LLFAAAGVKYEDVRFKDSAEWQSQKSNVDRFTWEKVPVLEITDGGKTTVLAQSKAIERFLAKRFGFFGSSDVETAHIDSVVEQLQDARQGYWGAKGKDEAVKAAGVTVEEAKTNMAKFTTEELPGLLKMFERVLHKAGGQHFAGGRLSLADILMYAFLTWPQFPAGAINSFPLLKGLVERVGQNHGIAQWVKARPDTPF